VASVTAPADRDADERAVRAVEAAYDAAWGRGDLDAVLDCVLDDVVVVTPRGDVAQGKAEFRALLERFLADEAGGTAHQSTVQRVVLVTDNVALVDAEAHISRPATDGSPAYTLRHGFTDVVVRRDGVWRISQIRAFPLPG
jgi:uncharacterized protein (TIGR02246 family)